MDKLPTSTGELRPGCLAKRIGAQVWYLQIHPFFGWFRCQKLDMGKNIICRLVYTVSTYNQNVPQTTPPLQNKIFYVQYGQYVYNQTVYIIYGFYMAPAVLHQSPTVFTISISTLIEPKALRCFSISLLSCRRQHLLRLVVMTGRLDS